VIGVIELASFTALAPFHIEFAEKMTENIAALLISKLQTDQMKSLLYETSEKAQIMASQEEEMKQTHEELMSVQEEMTRQRKHLELEIRLLREELASYEGKKNKAEIMDNNTLIAGRDN
jgi:methyl-accepting chemotaxis protein